MGKRLSKKRVKNALHQTKGAVYLAARVLDVSHTAVYNYVNKYDDIAEIKEFYDNEMVDVAEQGLRDALRKKDAWAIKYTLSTKGKHRGYVERQEITGKEGEALTIKYVNDWRDNSAIPASRADSG